MYMEQCDIKLTVIFTIDESHEAFRWKYSFLESRRLGKRGLKICLLFARLVIGVLIKSSRSGNTGSRIIVRPRRQNFCLSSRLAFYKVVEGTGHKSRAG